MDKNRTVRKTEKSLIKRNAVIAVLVSIFFIGIILMYFSMLMTERRNNIIKDGELAVREAAEQIDRYITTNMDSVELAAFALDDMIRAKAADEEIQEYLVAESTAIKNTVLENSTGLYGYINGRFFSGTNWIPPEGYDATERPWYRKPLETPGKTAILDPYLDVQSGNVMLALGKTLCDGESVVSVDVSLEQIQKMTESAVKSGSSDIEMIINDKGIVIAHSDRNEIGRNYSEEKHSIGALTAGQMAASGQHYAELEYEGSHYIAYVAKIMNGWSCVSIKDATEVFASLNRILFATIAVVILILLIVCVVVNRSNRYLNMSIRERAANEAKSAFLSNMSHEIRTPINAILGMDEMILRENKDPSIHSYAENIRTAGKNLLGMVNDILDFSKLEEGKIEIVPVEYDLTSLVNDLLNMIHTRIRAKGLSLIPEIDKETPKCLFGDALRLRQIIMNLLTNAVKYTEEGSITFRIGYERSGDDPDGIVLHVSVEDTGIGIKEEDLQKLFGKFERLDINRNRNIEGTGLGLSITESLLRKMGSFLDVDSEYGRGSTFSFALKQKVTVWEPIGDYEASYKEYLGTSEKHNERFTAPEARVLAVDDNPMNLMVLVSLLRETGMKIDTADDGFEGIKLCSENKYDLIFLDHMMPEKDGIETLHDIRKSDSELNAATPAVCLTANAIAGAREQFLSEGFNEYMTKPVDPDRLEEILIRYIPEEKVVMRRMEDTEAPKESDALPEELAVLNGSAIDAAEGLKISGSLEAYMSLLKVFHDSIEERAEELTRFYSEGDLKDYTIKVHALKSSARIIGANSLSDRAQGLEDAGKAGDLAYLQDNQESFINDYKEFKALLAPIFAKPDEPDPDRPEADSYMMEKAYEDIRAAAEEMDCDILETIFGEMSDYTIPAGDAELWEKLKACSNRFDYSGILLLMEGK